MTRPSLRLLEDPQLSSDARALLEASKSERVPYDVAAGHTRLRATLRVLENSASAAAGASTAAAGPVLKLTVLFISALSLGYAAYATLQSPVESRAVVLETSAAEQPSTQEYPRQGATPAPLQRGDHEGERTNAASKHAVRRSDEEPRSVAVPAPRSASKRAASKGHVQRSAVKTRSSPTPVAPSTTAAPESPRAIVEPKPEPPTATPVADTTVDELTGLARARTLLASRPQAALTLLHDLAHRYPHGYLVEEREALTVLALAARGERTLAKQRATAFLRTYPQSAFVARVRSVTER